MRMKDLWQLPAVVLLALSVQGGCILVPEIVDRIVELAVTGEVSKELDAIGKINVHNDLDSLDIRTELSLTEILDDNDIDVSDVKAVSVAGATYRTTQPDPEATREIQGGTVYIRREGGAEVPLVGPGTFNAVVNSVTTETTATLNAAGVAVINSLLQDLLAEAQGSGFATNTKVYYRLTGNSVPTGIATDFKWELRLKMNVVGKIEVEIPE